MKIALDIDGVLADFVGYVCTRLGQAGYPRTPESIKTERIRSSVTPPEQDLVDKFSAERGFCSRLPWYPGARVFLSTLQDIGDVYVLTAPWKSETWAAERRDWLAAYMPVDRVCSVPAESKAQLGAFADVLIEDSASTCAAWHAVTGRTAILIDRPWNQGNFPGCIRATSYQQAIAFVRSWRSSVGRMAVAS